MLFPRLCRSLCDIKQHGGTRYFRVCLHKDTGNYRTWMSKYCKFLLTNGLWFSPYATSMRLNRVWVPVLYFSYWKWPPTVWIKEKNKKRIPRVLCLPSSLQSFEKQGFHAGTPAASFSLPSALGSGGPINPPAAAGYAPAPFMHILAPHQQPHSQILHHHLQQDGQVVAHACCCVFVFIYLCHRL